MSAENNQNDCAAAGKEEKCCCCGKPEEQGVVAASMPGNGSGTKNILFGLLIIAAIFYCFHNYNKAKFTGDLDAARAQFNNENYEQAITMFDEILEGDITEEQIAAVNREIAECYCAMAQKSQLDIEASTKLYAIAFAYDPTCPQIPQVLIPNFSTATREEAAKLRQELREINAQQQPVIDPAAPEEPAAPAAPAAPEAPAEPASTEAPAAPAAPAAPVQE